MARALALFVVAFALIFGAVHWHGLANANIALPRVEYSMGLTLQSTTAGPKVASVDPKSAGAKHGIKKGDLILAIDGRYAKTLPRESLKDFATGKHDWRTDVILVRNNKDVITVTVDGF
jgi:C-terminal processing protease CtpA/Prc